MSTVHALGQACEGDGVGISAVRSSAMTQPRERPAAKRCVSGRPRPTLATLSRKTPGIEEPRSLSHDLLDSRDRARGGGEQPAGRYCQEEQDAELRDRDRKS